MTVVATLVPLQATRSGSVSSSIPALISQSPQPPPEFRPQIRYNFTTKIPPMEAFHFQSGIFARCHLPFNSRMNDSRFLHQDLTSVDRSKNTWYHFLIGLYFHSIHYKSNRTLSLLVVPYPFFSRTQTEPACSDSAHHIMYLDTIRMSFC